MPLRLHPEPGLAGASAACAVLVLAAYSGSNDGGASAAPVARTPPADSAAAAATCSAYAGTKVAASAISMPTTGATITAATLKAASGTGATAVGEYCQVNGTIGPVDPAAPPITFQVNLPTRWNTKAFQLGGGGFDGTLVTGLGNVPGSSNAIPTPLARGYATFGSDGGHSGENSRDGSFGLNEEALDNDFGDHLRKTRDVAVALMQTRYAAAPTRTYIAGGSGGGREALYAADRWPQLYDGVIAYYPAWSLTAMFLNYGRITTALAAPGAWPDPAKQALLYNAVIGACDALDGATDGVVSNLAACRFDPTTLRCPGGADTGDTCLSDAQIAGVRSYSQSLTAPFVLANGTHTYPAFNVYAGVNLSGPATPAGTVAPGSPSTLQMPFANIIYDNFVRYWVTRDANLNSLRFNPTATTAYVQRIQYISSRQDVKPDLSAFAARGGKLLMLHGDADGIIPTGTSEDLYKRLIASMGATTVASFMHFYEVPGYSHGFGAYTVAWDSVAALEAWREQGTGPTNQIVTDNNPATLGRTRPLCDYPTWPKYKGSGDINLAASYACASS